jgi:hypothetical protein
MSEHLWRVEIELKRDMVDYWNDCFDFQVFPTCLLHSVTNKPLLVLLLFLVLSNRVSKCVNHQSNHSNKKQERKDNADVEVMSEHLWRVEIELKRDMVDYWKFLHAINVQT